MEEIEVRTRVATQPMSFPFDYAKYRNALSFDKIEREDGWIDYYAIFKRKGTLGNRRKGIAIFGQVSLIDCNNNEILRVNEKGKLYRIFGGYYVNLVTKRYNYQTFPGQDRDTEYEEMRNVDALFDEYGNKLDYKQSAELFKNNDIIQALTAIEIGENRVFYKNALYDLNDYSIIKKYQKNIIIDGLFSNGYCKVKILDDNRDFIVAVYDHKISHVFTEKEFNRIKSLLHLRMKEDEPFCKISKIVDNRVPTGIIDEYCPNVEISIERYHASISPLIRCGIHYYQLNKIFFDELIEFASEKEAMGDDYYKRFLVRMGHQYYSHRTDSRWLHISSESYDLLYKKCCLINNNRPNFINKITKLGYCALFDAESLNYGRNKNEYEIYRFECRPYGYISTNGELIYDFDVNNIKW